MIVRGIPVGSLCIMPALQSAQQQHSTALCFSTAKDVFPARWNDLLMLRSWTLFSMQAAVASQCAWGQRISTTCLFRWALPHQLLGRAVGCKTEQIRQATEVVYPLHCHISPPSWFSLKSFMVSTTPPDTTPSEACTAMWRANLSGRTHSTSMASCCWKPSTRNQQHLGKVEVS